MPSIGGYLIISRKGPNWGNALKARWVGTDPKHTNPSEVVVHVEVEIPIEIFERPQLRALFKVDPAQIPPKEISKEVLVKAEKLLQAQTGFRVEFVSDPPPALKTCARCSGKGTVEDAGVGGLSIMCPDCKGTGTVLGA